MPSQTTEVVVFDVETTGLDVDKDRIVQFAAIKVTPDGFGDKLHMLINPQISISEGATEVHGITKADVVDCPKFADVADDILEFIGTDSSLAGHNILAFDLPILRAELERCHRTLRLKDRHLLDTLAIFRNHVPHTLEGAVAYYCGNKLDGAHDALVDAKAAGDVLFKQLVRFDSFDMAHKVSVGNRLTLDGKVIKNDNGDPCLSFGKHANIPLQDVNKNYLSWMLGANFSNEVKEFIARFL